MGQRKICVSLDTVLHHITLLVIRMLYNGYQNSNFFNITRMVLVTEMLRFLENPN